eukprot:260352-Chlamydomonas_euryale.AAC.5
MPHTPCAADAWVTSCHEPFLTHLIPHTMPHTLALQKPGLLRALDKGQNIFAPCALPYTRPLVPHPCFRTHWALHPAFQTPHSSFRTSHPSFHTPRPSFHTPHLARQPEVDTAHDAAPLSCEVVSAHDAHVRRKMELALALGVAPDHWNGRALRDGKGGGGGSSLPSGWAGGGVRRVEGRNSAKDGQALRT